MKIFQNPKWNAFTLVELLVVISIITILAAMLLPALKNAREAGKRAVCIGNLKQLGMAAIMYVDDYGGWLPPFHDDNSNSAYLRNGGGEEKGFLRIYTYVNNRKIFYCPNIPEGYVGIVWSNGAISYNWLSGPNTAIPPNGYSSETTPYQTTNQGQKTADTPLMADMVDLSFEGPTCHVAVNPEGGNILYVDGHVKWKPLKEMFQKSVYAWW